MVQGNMLLWHASVRIRCILVKFVVGGRRSLNFRYLTGCFCRNSSDVAEMRGGRGTIEKSQCYCLVNRNPMPMRKQENLCVIQFFHLVNFLTSTTDAVWLPLPFF